MSDRKRSGAREQVTNSWRVGVLALLFTGALAILFFRLWFVQLAAGPEWLVEADRNIVSSEPIAAPRGDIVDRNGLVLATSVPGLVIEIDRSLLPVEVEDDVLQRLAANPRPVAGRGARSRGTNPIRRGGRPAGVRDRCRHGLLDNGAASHPAGCHGSSPPRSRVHARVVDGSRAGAHGVAPLPAISSACPLPIRNTPIGKLGVESEYEQFLRGTPGKHVYRINPEGAILEEIGTVDPVPGATVRLTLDVEAQAEVERILIEAIALSNALKEFQDQDERDPARTPQPTERATAVVMEVNTGAILAMASYPTFEPQLFVGGIDVDSFEELSEHQAFNNLAIQGVKPPASTFKAITYVTAMEENIFPAGVSTPEETIECSPQLAHQFGDESQLLWRNWTYPETDGQQNLHDALRRSCNIYFWEVALSIWRAYGRTEREGMVQEWARAVGVGRPTQVDLPFEHDGILGDRELFEEWRERQPWRVRAEGWLGGDLMNLVVGQGPIVTTPLQMAVAYASILNGGTVYQPRVADAIDTADGERIRTLEPRVLRSVDISPETVASLRRDLTSVVRSGTAKRAFQDLGGLVELVGGKTGTAQSFTDQEGVFHDSTAWFVGAAPIDAPRWVVAVMVDEGGSGGAVAAPAARAIFQYLLGAEVTPLVAGEDTER